MHELQIETSEGVLPLHRCGCFDVYGPQHRFYSHPSYLSKQKKDTLFKRLKTVVEDADAKHYRIMVCNVTIPLGTDFQVGLRGYSRCSIMTPEFTNKFTVRSAWVKQNHKVKSNPPMLGMDGAVDAFYIIKEHLVRVLPPPNVEAIENDGFQWLPAPKPVDVYYIRIVDTGVGPLLASINSPLPNAHVDNLDNIRRALTLKLVQVQKLEDRIQQMS